jgi:CAAX protease family protein
VSLMSSFASANIDQYSVPDDLQRAVVFIQARRFAEAHHVLLRLVRDEPRNPRLWLFLAWTAPAHSAALEYYRMCCQLDPENELAKDGLASTYVTWSHTHKTFPAIIPSPFASLTEAAPRRPSLIQRGLVRLGQVPFTWIMVAYLVILAEAELITTFYSPRLGLVIHGFLLVILFLHASAIRIRSQSRLLYTMALAPLIRILSLSMPLLGFKFTYWYAIIGIPLLLSAYLVYRLTGYKLAEVGINANKLPLQLLIGLSGIGLGWLEYQILKPAPLVSDWRLQDVWLTALILLLFTGFLEEFIFRGLMQRAAQDVLTRFGIYYISLLFAILHIGYRSLVDFIFVLIVGVAFALITRYTRSIWGVTLAHGLTNIMLYIIMPFL